MSSDLSFIGHGYHYGLASELDNEFCNVSKPRQRVSMDAFSGYKNISGNPSFTSCSDIIASVWKKCAYIICSIISGGVKK